MTRELKLALIVGFALVLVVTVLISDHLSRARQTQLAGNIPSDPIKVVEPQAIAFANDPAPALTHADAPVASLPTPPASQPVAGGAAPASGTALTSIPNSGPMSDPAPITINQTPRGGHADLAAEVARNGGQIKNNDIILPPTLLQSRADRIGTDTGTVQPRSTSLTPLTGPSPYTPVTTPSLPASTDRIHVVATGDNTFKIAKQYYNDGKMWRKLVKYNGLSEDVTLHVGDKIKVPSAEVLLGKAITAKYAVGPLVPVVPVALTSKDVSFYRAGSKPVSAGVPISLTSTSMTGLVKSNHTYTVRKGDTLSEIARQELGSAKRAHEILDLNKTAIKDPDNIPLGAVLTLPAA